MRKPEEKSEENTKRVWRKVSIVTIVLVVRSVEEKVVYADSSGEAREKPKKEGRKEGRKRTKEARENQSWPKRKKKEKKNGEHTALER